MIEDVTTSGKSMEETVPKVRGAANVEIVGLMVSLNRNEKGKGEKTALTEVSELYGFPTAAIVSMPEVRTAVCISISALYKVNLNVLLFLR